MIPADTRCATPGDTHPRTLSPAEIRHFRETIRGFFRKNARRFAWRDTDDPYAVLVSEFMLQQTQTARVASKFDEWMARFPTARSVAEAPLSEALALWNGLGYNRRAKFLHETCAIICERHGGSVPRDVEALDALPGIGAYTARAIAAFSFGSPEVFVETNIRSVFIHCFFAGTPSVSDADILPLVRQTLDSENPREWYYALMDYGAHLKRSAENPSRKSAQYHRQTPFKGSFRQARGAILRQLARKGRATTLEIARGERLGEDVIQKAAERLAAEGMITRDGDVWTLNDGGK